MRKGSFLAIFLVLLFVAPANNGYSPLVNPASTYSPYESDGDTPFGFLAGDGMSGSGDPLSTYVSGILENTTATQIDSSTSSTSSLSVPNGYSGTGLDVGIDSLSMTVTDTLRNPSFTTWHDERWHVNPSPSDYYDDNIDVPDSWTLVKSVGYDNPHPLHGDWELNDYADGFGGSRAWRFEATIGGSDSLAPDDAIYLNQFLHAPWRDLYEIRISFYYYVLSSSDMFDQVHLFFKLGDLAEEKFHVFQSGDTTDTWLQETITYTSADLSSVMVPDSLLFSIGLATDVSGTLGTYREAFAYIDEVEIEMDVRPYPEQIGLSANNTAVIGSIAGNISSFVPDNDGRDCWDYSTQGIDLDGYNNDGRPQWGLWGTFWNTSEPFELGLQFPLDIPKGAVIENAYVEIQSASGSGVVNGRVHVSSEMDAGGAIESFTPYDKVGAHLEDTYSWLAASCDWQLTAWGDGVRYATPDIAPLLQNVVSSSDWSRGQYVAVMVSYMWSSYYQYYNNIRGSIYDTNDADDNARLYVSYRVPLAEDVVLVDREDARRNLKNMKDVTVDHTKVAVDLTDFPLLIDIIDTDLHTDVFPGGDDIAFMIDGQFVEHEIEFFDQNYSPTEAHLVAWVKVPFLSSSTDTIITMLYGGSDARSLETKGVFADYEIVHHMNEAPNGTLVDSSGNLHYGYSFGEMTYSQLVAGAIGSSINFDGSGDAITVGQIDTDDWSSFTVTGWVSQDVVGDDRIFSKAPDTDPSNAIIHLAIDTTPNLRVRMNTDGTGGGSSGSVDSNAVLTPGNWVYLAWSWSAATESIRLYVNGTFDKSVARDGDTVLDSIIPFVIGNWQTGPNDNRFFDGKIDEIRMTQMVLSDGWIETEFNNQLNPSTFYSVGSEQSNMAAPSVTYASVQFTTGSSIPVNLGFTLALDFEGFGKSLDENFNEGTTFHAENGSNTVTWIAKVLVSPLPNVAEMEVQISYPMTEWRPTAVTNPIGVSKTYPTDWIYTGGILTLLPAAVDVYGVWILEFEGLNYLSNLQLGVDGGPLSSTGEFQTNHTMRFEGTSIWQAGSSSQLYLTDPTGSIWSTPITHNTVGSDAHEIPSFQFRKVITIDNTKVYGDVVNFPFLLDITDVNVDDRAQADGDDILFVQNGIVIPHELVEYSVAVGSAHIVAWVRGNLSNTVDTDITMYYGNPIVGPQEQPSAVWGDEYVGVYHLEESPTGAKGEILDSTTYGNDGTTEGSMNSADLVDAVFGKGLDFDEIDDLIRIKDDASLDSVATAGTIQLWIWWDNAADGEWQNIMDSSNRFNGNPNDGFEWAQQNDGDHFFYPWAGTGSDYNLGTNPFTNQQWHHLAVTLNYTTKSVKIYVDGSAIPITIPNVPIFWTQIANPGDWLWGGDPDQPLRYFDGMFDEIRIANVERSAGWLFTEFVNQDNPTTFYNNIGSEQSRQTYTPSFVKALDDTAAAGVWTATAFFNDSGSAVDCSVGIYEREFIVKHDTSLTLQEPSDAVTDRLTVTTAGEWIYVEYELTDDITAAGVPEATVTLNWTVSGAPTQITLDDFGSGTYGKMLNTDNLGTAQQWRVNLQSTHQFYNDATEYFKIDLYHQTNLDYGDVTTTPADADFTATLTFTDTYDGSPIVGAEITLDGSPVTHIDLGQGKYSVSIPTGALSLGQHWYIFNATLSGSYLEMASVNITFTLRQHFTSVNLQGNLVRPYGFDTQFNVILLDLDIGGTVPLSAVSQFSFDPASYGVQTRPGTSYSITLTTDTWAVATESVTLTITMADAKYATPQAYSFDITIRSRYTSVSVSGSLVQPYGNATPLSVNLWDHDAGEVVPIGVVSSLIFTWPGDSQAFNNPTSYSLNLDTSTWDVGVTTVTLIVTIIGDEYSGPSNFIFDITIRSMSTVLYHDPSDLVFAEGSDFWIDLRVNVSEPGTSFGLPVTGLTQGEFSLSGNPYPFTIDTTDNLNGRYRLTISYSDLGGGSSFTITVLVNPSDANHGGAQVTIHFFYAEVQTSLTSPTHPQVTTPFATDVQLTLNYTDIESGTGIAGATITNTSINIYGLVDQGTGIYTLWLDVTGLAEGTHAFSLGAVKNGYEARSLSFTVRIRIAYTYAIPSIGALDIPIGNSPVFYVDYWDIDHDVPVDNSSAPYTRVLSTWHNFTVTYIPAQQKYQITFMTSDSDSLQSNTVCTFNFSRGSNYQFGIFTITFSIRTHNTDFRLTSAIEPTSNVGTINISVYYGDLDNNFGVDSVNVVFRVDNASGTVMSSSLSLGSGFYRIQVAADQFGLGVQTFTVYADWMGPFAKYQNKNFVTTASIVGLESALTLYEASAPTPYLELMNYKFFYSELSGIGIDNLTGNVFVYVSFQGESVDLGQVNIFDYSATQPGNYSIQFNTSIFDRTGIINMNVFVNWSKGVAPFYQNRTDIVTLRILPRDTLVSVVPPSPTSYLENASFTFTYEDIAGETGSLIYESSSLKISSNVTFSVSEIDGTYTFEFNTSQFGALGMRALLLDVTWAGSPFYLNRTGIIVYITVVERQTFLEYLAPAPTQYNDNVQFNVTWTDITGGASDGIIGATLTLYQDATPINPIYYSWLDIGGGIYSVDLSASYNSPSTNSLRVEMSIGLFYISDSTVDRQFTIRERITLLSAEPVRDVPYSSDVEIILYYQDLYTTSSIPNVTGAVTFEILNPGVWNFMISYNFVNQYYELSVTTSDHLELLIGVTYTFNLRMTYDSIAPYYASDGLYVDYEIRVRDSTIELDTAPTSTAYNNDASFAVYYEDADAVSGIAGADISVYLNGTQLIENTDYTMSEGYAGLYLFDVDTGALVGLGLNTLVVYANWPGTPYHENLTISVEIHVRERSTIIEFTQPPARTEYLDDVTFKFVFNDLDTGAAGGSPVTDLTKTEVRLYYENGTEIPSSYFSLTPSGDAYEIVVNSAVLSAMLDSDYSLRVDVDWNIGTAPYYEDDSTTLRVTIVGRSMFVDPATIETTPQTGPGDTETMFVNFTVSDASNGNPISGAIIVFTCVEQPIFTYVKNEPQAGVYSLEVDTASLTTVYGANTYHFELRVQWNPSNVPYYQNRSAIVLTGVVDLVLTSLQAEAPQPAAPYIGQNVSLIVTFTDIDHGMGIDGAGFLIEYVVGPAFVESPDYKGTGVQGQYNITFGTSNILSQDSYVLRITFSKTGYSPQVVLPTITVQNKPTRIDVHQVSYVVNWTELVTIYINFTDTFNDELIPLATVTWSYRDYQDQSFVIAGNGIYSADITADIYDADTWVLSIKAEKATYQIATATITLVVLPLPSELQIREPGEAVKDVNRGDPVDITIFLYDVTNNLPIAKEEVDRVIIRFEGVDYPMDEHINGSAGYYQGSIPGSATGGLIPHGYDVRMTAEFTNYKIAVSQFRIFIQQTPTEIRIWDEDLSEFRDSTTINPLVIEAVYLEVVNLTLQVIAPAFTNATFTWEINNSIVNWFESRWNIDYNFTNKGNGIYELMFNTSEASYGTWGLTFTSRPDPSIPENAFFAEDAILVTLVIKKIPTEVIPPYMGSKIWGWKGNFSFYYHDTHYDRGVSNATVTYDYYTEKGLQAFDLGNGSYLIYIDTTILLPSPNLNYPILVTFEHEGDYESRTLGVLLTVLEVPTEILTSITGAIIDSVQEVRGVTFYELQVAFGGDIEFEFFYNDTDNSEGYVGGLAGSSTNLTELYGDNMDAVVPILMDLGDGRYAYIFSTLNNWLFNRVGSVPSASENPYTFRVSLWLANRTYRTVEIKITIIEVPTSIEIVDFDFEIGYGLEGYITLRYWDEWNNLPITGANLTAETANQFVEITSTTEDSTPGQYTIRFIGSAGLLDIFRREQEANIVFDIYKDNYQLRSQIDLDMSLIAHVSLTPMEAAISTYGFYLIPLSIVVMMLLGAYVRVWSVPKRIRQINGQIKRIRKGKIPKPISDVLSRQELVADLFNDTYTEMKLTRAPSQMPEESIEIAVPEMGELLIQLAILTNLSADELEEFQADISKMRLSEQAAFVREVIMQEAVRAARRDGKTPEEVVEEVRLEALRRVSGEEGLIEAGAIVREKEEEAIRIVAEEKPEEEVKPDVAPPEEEVAEPGEKLSQFELEELRKELESRGVPPHEIDTIMEQARVLPRELVEELVESLGDRKK